MILPLPAALPTIERRVEKSPDDALLRNDEDNPWTNVAITCGFRRLTWIDFRKVRRGFAAAG